MSAHATTGLCYYPDMEQPRTMTEPELRRAMGEVPFASSKATASMAAHLLWEASVVPAGYAGRPYAKSACAVMLRAIVQQALVDRIVAWCEDVVSP